MSLKRDTKELLSESNLFDLILVDLCEADGVKPPGAYEVCRKRGISYGALLAWIAEDKLREEKFSRALRIRAQLLADQMIEIADTPQIGIEKKIKDDGSVEITESDMLGHRKLQVQARQWLTSKLDRKRFGEHVTHEVEATLTIVDAAKELEMLERKLGLREPLTIEHEPVAALQAPNSPAGGGHVTPAAGAAEKPKPSGRDPATIENPEL